MNIIRRVFEYKVDDASLNTDGKKYRLNEYIREFCMDATVAWHTVDYMFIPVHLKAKHHWVLVVISFNNRCIYAYDSLSTVGHDAVVLAEIEKLAEAILDVSLHVFHGAACISRENLHPPIFPEVSPSHLYVVEYIQEDHTFSTQFLTCID
ncbi:hypothetical protein BC332_33407 [Capsicum chinense]|nr:hypothetical protein BC332_33407 [Capsicum chinense]